MRVRLWTIRHTLPKAQMEELLAWKRGETGRPEVLTYRKYRRVKDVEAESVEDAVKTAQDDRQALPDGLEGWRVRTDVLGACDAQDGEKCLELEGCFSATEVPLFEMEVKA